MPTLQFKGKSAVQSLHLTTPYHQLIPDAAASQSQRPGIDDNLIIHGDNLLVLKALLPAFGGKITCIYIDPPYNTGNEGWIYNDNVNSPVQQEWLHKTVGQDDLTRHDKWLCMMLPRLKLLRELLRDDGVIFVSIDDHELHHLRMLMDEIFGEENFIATVIWQKVYSPRMDTDGFSVDHDYIIMYGKSAAAAPQRLTFAQNRQQFNLIDQQTGRSYRRRSLRKEGKDPLRADVPAMFFPLQAPDGTAVLPLKPDGIEGRWRWSLKKYEQELAAGNVDWVCQAGSWQVYAKQYLNPEASRPPTTLWMHVEVGHNHEAQEEVATLLGRRVFETPKPTRLIKRMLQVATQPDESAIILDSFAGSGSTAQAVLALNAEDGGNRRFILVEQEAYAETLTAERVRRVIAGVPGAKDGALRTGYGGSFSFLRLGAVLEEETLLRGDSLPSYHELARYIFFSVTGEQIDEAQIDEARAYLGSSSQYDVYMLYQPDRQYLRQTALTLTWVQALGPPGEKQRLVVAPHKYLDDDILLALRMQFCQLPFALYRFRA